MKDTDQLSARLVNRLKQAQIDDELNQHRAVIMHDFSLDRLIHLDDYAQFVQQAGAVFAQKGGLLPKSRQTLQQGGCAANTATALARLGVETYFITRTNDLGHTLLEFYLERQGVNISHVKLGGQLALMTALEVGRDKINIMINDGESFAPFGFDDLEPADLHLIESAQLVGVFDWGLNLKGTDLAGRLFDFLAGKDIITYLDTSDPAPRKPEIPELFDRVLSHPALSYLNLNENELKQYNQTRSDDDTPPHLLELARQLKAKIPAELNVHTASMALWVGRVQQVVPTYRLNPLRTTGAGDSWNGGNMLGLLLDLPAAERLLLANAVAGYYITSAEATRPTLPELIQFIEQNQEQLIPNA